MKSSITKLAAVFTLGVATVAATSSFACGGGGGGGKKGGGFSVGGGRGGLGVGYGNGNFGVRVGGGNVYHGNHNGNYNHGESCHNGPYGGTYNNGGGYNPTRYLGQAYEPSHSTYIVQPFDTFYLVSQKEYGNSVAAPHIAKFNNLTVSAALTPGQRLLLPSISASGQLSLSRRPSAGNDVTPVAGSTTSPVTDNLKTTTASAVQASARKPAVEEEEEALPKVTVGSTLAVDGETFGEERGAARLRISGLAFPVEVIEWTNTSTKVRLPQLEVTSPTKAELEIVRADGSVAVKSGIELAPMADRLALSN